MGWTEEQQKAIDEEGKNIIVSAGAGSGKTAVLTARVLRKLLQGIHVNELLILTFTNAAAWEMKERIRSTIRKTPGLEEEAALLEEAYITTFDAFSLAMVKKYHTYLNISQNVQVADEVLIDMEKKRILDEIFDQYYLSPKKNFSKLISDFCLKDDEELKKYLLNAYRKIELKYDKTDYLKNYLLQMNESKAEEFIQEYVDLLYQKQQLLQDFIHSMSEYFDGDFVSKVEHNFSSLLDAKTYEDFLRGCNYQSITVPRGSSEEAKKMKACVFDTAHEIKDLCIYSSIQEIRNEILSTQDSIQIIVEILQELDRRLDSYKMEHQLFSFQDISRLAIQVVMENDAIREELMNQFQEILVDEYQDTSDIQEVFISLISRNNVYMVGDIKQSIYRFRNANPIIFKDKYNLYRDTEQGTKIDLLKNFRSRREVLEDINLLFDLFMDEELGGADYKTSHRMSFGNDAYSLEGATEQNYQMELLTYDKTHLGRITSSEEEAFVIGYDILERVNHHFQVFDKEEKKLRDIEYRDFVILLDRSKDFDLYKKVFEYLHIPLTVLKDESLKKENDILVIKNLIQLLICMKEENFDSTFRYAFTSVSRSFLYPTLDSEIYKNFALNTFPESSLYQKCLECLTYIDHMSLSQFFLFLLDQFHYEEKLLTIGNVHYFRTRLEYLYQLCHDYEKMGKTIYDFMDYLNEIMEGDYDLSFSIPVKETNSCRIMTIHKSKGLEFPICYFASLASKFNMNEFKEKILFDNHYGFILPKVDESYKDTILKILFKTKMKREEISERIRLFYVALTRAKEKMIFVLPKLEEEEEVLELVPIYQRENYSSFLSILKSIYSVLLPYVKETTVLGVKDYLMIAPPDSIQKKEETLSVNEIHIPSIEIEKKHYSKEKLSLYTKEEKELLRFGTTVHEILEEINFLSYDLSKYSIPSFIQKKIKAFLESDFMKDKLLMKMYKEYEFVYQEDAEELHGVIDLLLESDQEMIIIDYKLKNIEDEAYDKQLNGYRKFIEKKSKKLVSCYLYSIFDAKYRKIS